MTSVLTRRHLGPKQKHSKKHDDIFLFETRVVQDTKANRNSICLFGVITETQKNKLFNNKW